MTFHSYRAYFNIARNTYYSVLSQMPGHKCMHAYIATIYNCAFNIRQFEVKQFVIWLQVCSNLLIKVDQTKITKYEIYNVNGGISLLKTCSRMSRATHKLSRKRSLFLSAKVNVREHHMIYSRAYEAHLYPCRSAYEDICVHTLNSS